MIINNIDKITKLLKFKPGTFYYLQILQRKKDNPSNLKDKKVYQRFITSFKDLNNIISDIKLLCKVYNARAYISLVSRSNEKFTKECLRSFTNKVCSNLFENTFLIPEKVVLLPQVAENKIWILDVDNKNEKYIRGMIKIVISKLTPCIWDILDTPNGYHIITDTFNLKSEGLIDLEGDNYKIEDFEFTLRKEALTIFYADIK